MDLDALEAVDLTCLADFRLHREDLQENLTDGRNIGDGREEDPALLHAALVLPFVVDELPSLHALDHAEFEPPLAEGEVHVHLDERAEALCTRQEGARLAEVLVPRLQLDEVPRARVHVGRERGMDKKIAGLNVGRDSALASKIRPQDGGVTQDARAPAGGSRGTPPRSGPDRSSGLRRTHGRGLASASPPGSRLRAPRTCTPAGNS